MAKYQTDGTGRGCGVLSAVLVVGLILAGIAAFASAQRVDAGEACGVLQYGKMREDVAGPGFNWTNPFGTSYKCYSTRDQTLEFGAGEDSKSNYIDTAITTETKDGVPVAVTGIVRFSIPPEKIPTIYKNVGKDVDQVNSKLVQPVSREQIRNVIQQTPISVLYPGGMPATSAQITKVLAPVFAERGIVLRSFNLTTVDPGQAYRDAIQQQQLQVEAAKQKKAEVNVAKQEAERQKAEAQGKADAAVIAAKGDADAARERGKAAREYPETVQLAYYDALKTVTWMILDSKDVQPTMPVPSVATPAP